MFMLKKLISTLFRGLSALALLAMVTLTQFGFSLSLYLKVAILLTLVKLYYEICFSFKHKKQLLSFNLLSSQATLIIIVMWFVASPIEILTSRYAISMSMIGRLLDMAFIALLCLYIVKTFGVIRQLHKKEYIAILNSEAKHNKIYLKWPVYVIASLLYINLSAYVSSESSLPIDSTVTAKLQNNSELTVDELTRGIRLGMLGQLSHEQAKNIPEQLGIMLKKTDQDDLKYIRELHTPMLQPPRVFNYHSLDAPIIKTDYAK